MAAVELDVAQLATFCSVPQETITTLVDAPTADLVRTLLENISAKAREFNGLTSEKLRLGVELENAVRGAESKSRILKSSIDKAHRESAGLRQKLQAEETARAAVETELENLRNSTLHSTSDISTLKTRIESLESSNRDTLSLLDSKTTAYDNLAQELEAQHQKSIELRREVSSFEQSVQSANAAFASARYHEQGLQQEVESLKRNNDWLDKELKTKSEEFTKYRKEKGLRIAELQRQCDDATSAVEAANRTETTLRRRIAEVSQKADDSLSQIQQMQEEAAKRDQAFKVELDAANRLTELTRNSATTERKRQQDLAAQLESAKDDAAEQLGRLSAELETEHGEREAAEVKIAELEVHIEQLQAELSAARALAQPSQSAHQGVNGYPSGPPARGSSTPSGSPKPKGGLSLTQMYSNYNELKSSLDFEKRRNEQLSSTLDEMVQDLENRQPEIEEMRADQSRLESEISELSSLIDIIGKERDQAVKAAKRSEGRVEAKMTEGEVLRQQLRDVSSQVKVFLMEVHLRDQGLGDVDAGGRARLDRIAHGQFDEEAFEGSTDTDRFISSNLVTFRNISELQEQNTNLLRITRELGERMEHEEAVKKQLEDTRNWDELQQKYERCKDEVKSLVTQSQSYIRERDMFRRMLSHRGQLPAGSDLNSLFGESFNGDGAPTTPRPAGVMDSVEDLPSAKDLSDYAKLYKDMQAHFDAYRNEAATDRSTLKEQVDNLSRLNGELRSEAARSSSQVVLAHERYKMLNENYSMLMNENAELKRRSQHLSESAGKQEMQIQQVAEDLVEAKGTIDSMRNETANLKAEKDFWKSIEKRLTEDNENLLNERGRLNTLNANLQNLLNEREHSDTEGRRRLQTQVDNLERELQTTKAKLSEETEENRRLAQRREYDHEQSQKRIDDLISSLGTIREQLVAANTTKDHLSTRVDELTIELRSAEERVTVLQPAPTPRLNVTNGDESQRTSADGEDSGLSKEQELAVQVSELKRDLDLTRTELENVKGQVEQYKAISQASEEELSSLNETQDLYRQECDKLIEEKDNRTKELEQQVKDTTAELAATNSELSELRNEQSENGRRLDEQKKVFESDLAKLRDDADRHAAAAQYYQEDLKAQANIAQQAQQNYESELIKHGDAAKALQKVRADYNELSLEVAGIKAEAESARTSLSQSEQSWVESRERYEREVEELKASRENLTAQNNRLHQQLENVTAQISSLSKRVSTDAENSGDDVPASNLENLQEVINYLRREKAIVDVQLELSTQGEKRLKQQLDYAQRQLDDTRLRLNQQMRVEAENQRTSLDHNRLMETINELNTFRESSVTLRAESRQAQAALATKTKEVEELIARIEPLRAEVLDLKNELETKEGENKLLKENSDRWQQRVQNVLQKYDRIDPAELEALKEQVKTLETERDELLSSRQTLQEQAESAATQISQAQDQSNEKIETMRARLTDQFKARSKTLSDRIKERDSALQTAVTEKQELEQRLAGLSGLQQELDTARAERDAAAHKAGVQPATADANAHEGSEDGQVNEGDASKFSQAELQAAQEQIAAAEARANEEASEAASLRNQLDAATSRIAELEEQINKLHEIVNTSKAELAQLQIAQQPANLQSSRETEEHIQKLRKDLAQAQQDAENVRTTASVNASIANAPTEDGSTSLADQVAEHVEAIRAELEARHNERVKIVDETLQKRTDVMKANLTKKLTEGKSQIRQSLAAEHEQALQALKTEHEHELERLRVRHKDELEELKRLDKGQQATHTTNGESNVESEGGTPRGPWQPSEAEIRTLAASNDVLRTILRKNVNTQVTKAKEELSARLNEEHEKLLTDRIAEVQTKAKSAQEHAVMMEGKKTALQVNLASNKMKIAQFKLDLVDKAAKETPQKAVVEVWTNVKDAKPPTQPANIASPPQQDAAKALKPPMAMTVGQPNPFAQIAAQQKPPTTAQPQPNPFAQQAFQQPPPTTQNQTNPFVGATTQHKGREGILLVQLNPFSPSTSQDKPSQAHGQLQQPSGVSTFGRPTPATSPPPSSPRGQQSPSQQAKLAQQPAASSNSSQSPNQQVPSSQQTSNSAPKPTQGTANHHPNAGTGPGALRGLQQSGLPMARGGSIRGGASVRGRGSGIPRGDPQGINTRGGPGPQAGRGSPTSNLNAGAKQFVPGNKRPRDETQDGQQGGDGTGKRIRGGGGGGS